MFPASSPKYSLEGMEIKVLCFCFLRNTSLGNPFGFLDGNEVRLVTQPRVLLIQKNRKALKP